MMHAYGAPDDNVRVHGSAGRLLSTRAALGRARRGKLFEFPTFPQARDDKLSLREWT